MAGLIDCKGTLNVPKEDKSQFPFVRLYPRAQDCAYGGLWQLYSCC